MNKKWEDNEIKFLKEKFPSMHVKELAEIWQAKFGISRTSESIKHKAIRLGVKTDWNLKGVHDFQKCPNCGKVFRRGSKYIYKNVKFCSPKCRGEFRMKEHFKKLGLTNEQYSKIYRRDYNYIDKSFIKYCSKSKIAYDDVIAYFWEHQFKSYVKICCRRNKRIRLDLFMKYAGLHVLRDYHKQGKVVNRLLDGIKLNDDYEDLPCYHRVRPKKKR